MNKSIKTSYKLF